MALAGAIAFGFEAKTTATLSVQHDRDPVAVRLSDGTVRNAYTVKLLNKSSVPHTYTLSVDVDAKLAIVGNDGSGPVKVGPDASESLRVTLTAASARGEVVFTARDETGATVLTARDRFVEH